MKMDYKIGDRVEIVELSLEDLEVGNIHLGDIYTIIDIKAVGKEYLLLFGEDPNQEGYHLCAYDGQVRRVN